MAESREPAQFAEARSEKGEPLRVQELSKDKNDPDPKALACYGMFEATSSRMHLRFVSGRPVSQVTTDSPLVVVCTAPDAGQKRSGAHLGQCFPGRVSKQVKTWLREHNQTVLQETQTGKAGVRIIPCWLPTKSPWLNRTLAEMGPGPREPLSSPLGCPTASEREIRGSVTTSAVSRWSRLRTRLYEQALAPDSHNALPGTTRPAHLQSVTAGGRENGKESPFRPTRI